MKTGLAAQLGFANEAAWGDFQAPARWLPFLSEDIGGGPERLESDEIYPGARLLRSDQWEPGAETYEGPIDYQLRDRGLGLWLEHCFGTVVSSQPDNVGSPTVWEHTYTLGDLDGKSVSVQVGRPSLSGTVHPFSYVGCKVASWSIAGSVGEIGSLSLDITARAEDRTQALGVPAVPTSRMLTFVGASVSIAAANKKVTSVDIGAETNLAADRHRLGSALVDEQLDGATRDITGNLDADFDDLTDYERFVNGTEAELVLAWTGGIIEDAFRFALEITANIRFDGETPNVTGKEELRQPLPYKVVDPGAGGISAVYRTTDSTP